MNLAKCEVLVPAFGVVVALSVGAATLTAANPLTAFPASLKFEAQPIGTKSSQQDVTLSNTGNQTIVFDSIGLTGANAGDFALGTNCGSSLGAGDSCTLFLSFTPSAVGTRTGAVTITGDFEGNRQTVSLSGIGLADASSLTVSPSSLNFGSQYVTATTNSLASVVTNTGSFNVNFSAVGIGGKNASDFALDASQCGASLPVGSSCNLIVTFTPSGSGVRAATLTLADDATGSPQEIVLSGTGVAAVTSLSINPTAVSFGAQTSVQALRWI